MGAEMRPVLLETGTNMRRSGLRGLGEEAGVSPRPRPDGATGVISHHYQLTGGDATS